MKKRGVADIKDYVELRNLITMVLNATPIPYINAPEKQIRDKALLAFIAATGMRISEALSVSKNNFDLTHDRGFIIIRNVRILKRRKEVIIKDFVLPKTGILKPLTDLVMKHYHLYGYSRIPLFDMTRQRAWQIIVGMTGKWCHYFRSQRLSYLVNSIRSTTRVCKMLGIRKPETLLHYDKGGWQQHRKELAPE